jgi:type IV pilus assembly protein PilA
MDDLAKGFRSIDHLIVLSVLLIIAAIVIPNLLHSRMAANQASAVASIRLINAAEAAYSTTYKSGFSSTLIALVPSATPGASPTSTRGILIDSVLATGQKRGYKFSYSPGPKDSTGHVRSYTVTAVPVHAWSGKFSYYSDQSGVIRQNSQTTASSTDSPIR